MIKNVDPLVLPKGSEFDYQSTMAKDYFDKLCYERQKMMQQIPDMTLGIAEKLYFFERF